VEADRLTGLGLETLQHADAFDRQADVDLGPKLMTDATRAFAGRALAKQIGALEQQHVGLSTAGEVVGGTDAHDPAAHDHHRRVARQHITRHRVRAYTTVECHNGRMTQAEVRRYQTRAGSTDTFGRVLVSARDQHLIVDGPVQNGCPGEAITPAELFLSGVAACGVELIQVLAKGLDVPLRGVTAAIEATQDPSAPVRSDVNLFNTVRISLELSGVSQEQGQDLVDRFKRR
jgi:uncharacterized OsmC-like protein